MDVFEFAKKMEKDGEKYYRDLAETQAHKGLRSVFSELADDELNHFEVLEGLQKQIAPDLIHTTVLDLVDNVFAKMKEAGSSPGEFSSGLDGFTKALELERQSLGFYSENAKKCEDERAETMLLRIADEERKHIQVMEMTIEFFRDLEG